MPHCTIFSPSECITPRNLYSYSLMPFLLLVTLPWCHSSTSTPIITSASGRSLTCKLNCEINLNLASLSSTLSVCLLSLSLSLLFSLSSLTVSSLLATPRIEFQVLKYVLCTWGLSVFVRKLSHTMLVQPPHRLPTSVRFSMFVRKLSHTMLVQPPHRLPTSVGLVPINTLSLNHWATAILAIYCLLYKWIHKPIA